MTIQVERAHGLEALGIVRSGRVHWNLSPAALYEEALRRRRGAAGRRRPAGRPHRPAHRTVAERQVRGARAVERAARALGRGEPADRRGEVRRAAPRHDGLPPGQGAVRPRRLGRHRPEVPAADPRRQRVRVAQPVRAQHVPARGRPGTSRQSPSGVHGHRPAELQGRPGEARHRAPMSSIFVHFGRKLVLIGGTHYAGEIKKSIFTILNYTLPLQGVLSMHCSANIGADGDTALFFGLSGTGKTTLSSDPAPPPDRRRRARLERHRRLQLRRRLLRQGDQAVGGGRAADLRDDATLRHHPRERGRRPGAAHARSR